MTDGLVKRVMAVILTVAMSVATFASLSGTQQVSADQPAKKFYLSEAKKLAVSKSKEYKKIKVDILTKQAKYADAVARIKAKKKRLSTFTWSPLLSFHFPEDPSFTEEFEFNFKPVSIQYEISDLRHKLSDQIYVIYEDITNLYISTYTLQEKIKFNSELLEEKKKTLEKNKIRLLKGLASQNDIDSIEKSIKKLEDTISTDMTSLENNKDKIKDKTGVDVRSGYTFVNPYIDMDIARESLTEITDYTVANSQTMFEARTNTTSALRTLDLYYSLMVSAYGGKMSAVSAYVQQAKRGQEIDGEVLKTKFDRLLVEIDKKWDGKKRILFVKIPRVRWKGETDGSRYIEDEPFALYNAILDYQSSRQDLENTEKDVRNEVKDAFENLKALEKAYKSLADSLKEESTELKRALAQNQLGELTFEEYTQQQEQYEQNQLDTEAALDSYTQSLISFDRLTCGAISLILTGAGVSPETTVGGDSYLIPEEVEGLMYYIKYQVESNIFDMGLYIPDNFEIEFDKFELWVDTKKVAQSDAELTIKHMGMILDGSENVFLRFYNGDNVICDCEIDPSEYSGPLTLIAGYHLKPMEEIDTVLGTYTIRDNPVTGMQVFRFEPSKTFSDIKYFRLTNSAGNALVDSEPVAVTDEKEYVVRLTGAEEALRVEALNDNYEVVAIGTLDPDMMQIIKLTNDEGGTQ